MFNENAFFLYFTFIYDRDLFQLIIAIQTSLKITIYMVRIKFFSKFQ